MRELMSTVAGTSRSVGYPAHRAAAAAGNGPRGDLTSGRDHSEEATPGLAPQRTGT